MYPNERQAIIAAIAARLRARVFDYAMMEVVNNGKPITQAINDVSRATNHLDTYAGAAYEIKGETFDPLDPRIVMGPQASKVQFDKILSYLDIGLKEGATFLAGGQRARIPGLENGLFIQPTLLGNVRNEMRVMQEEIFGPVTRVLRRDDEDEMIRQANDTSFGLAGGGLWTRNLDRAHKLSRRLETGMIWINRYLNLKPNQWMGGVKASGYGRGSVRATIEHYTFMKSLVINLD